MKNTNSNTQQTAKQVLKILDSLHRIAVGRGVSYGNNTICSESLAKIRKGDINSAFGQLNALLKFYRKTSKQDDQK